MASNYCSRQPGVVKQNTEPAIQDEHFSAAIKTPHLGHLHLISECLDSSPGSAPDSSFLLMCTLEDNAAGIVVGSLLWETQIQFLAPDLGQAQP